MALPLPENSKGNWKMSCSRCETEVEFPTSREGQTIPCPRCGLEVVLYLPRQESPKEIPQLNNTKAGQQPQDSGPEKLWETIGLVGGLVFVGGIICVAYYFHFYPTSNLDSQYVSLERLNTRQDGIIIGVAACIIGFLTLAICIFLHAITVASQKPPK